MPTTKTVSIARVQLHRLPQSQDIPTYKNFIKLNTVGHSDIQGFDLNILTIKQILQIKFDLCKAFKLVLKLVYMFAAYIIQCIRKYSIFS